ncbi:MAG: hypothetical protein IJ180_01580 [Bacteroidales bacterium]|nr:hypothetical protein [Bacteroidales bacterium]
MDNEEIKAYNKFVEDFKSENKEILVEPPTFKGNRIIKFSQKQIQAFDDFKNIIMSTFKGIEDIQIPNKIVIENFKVKIPVITFYGNKSKCRENLKFTLTQEIKERIDILFRKEIPKWYTKKGLEYTTYIHIDTDYLNNDYENKFYHSNYDNIYTILYNFNHFPKSASLQITYKGITDEISYNLTDYNKLYYGRNVSEICKIFQQYIIDDFIKELTRESNDSFEIVTDVRSLLIKQIPRPSQLNKGEYFTIDELIESKTLSGRRLTYLKKLDKIFCSHAEENTYDHLISSYYYTLNISDFYVIYSNTFNVVLVSKYPLNELVKWKFLSKRYYGRQIDYSKIKRYIDEANIKHYIQVNASFYEDYHNNRIWIQLRT